MPNSWNTLHKTTYYLNDSPPTAYSTLRRRYCWAFLTILFLLDLCAVVDTLDHAILLEQLCLCCIVEYPEKHWNSLLLSWKKELSPFIMVAIFLVFCQFRLVCHEDRSLDPHCSSFTSVHFQPKQPSRVLRSTSSLTTSSSWAENSETWYIRNRVKFNWTKITLVVTNTKRQISKQSTPFPPPPPFSIGGIPVVPFNKANEAVNNFYILTHIRCE